MKYVLQLFQFLEGLVRVAGANYRAERQVWAKPCSTGLREGSTLKRIKYRESTLFKESLEMPSFIEISLAT